MKHIESIDTCGFQGTNFSHLRIPGNVKIIGWDAFKGCRNLTSVEIDERVTHIGVGAFCNNYVLEKIILPSSLEEVGNGFLACCYEIRNVIMKAVIPPADKSEYNNSYFSEKSLTTVHLYVPTQSIELYRNHPIWGKVEKILPIN